MDTTLRSNTITDHRSQKKHSTSPHKYIYGTAFFKVTRNMGKFCIHKTFPTAFFSKITFIKKKKKDLTTGN